MRTPIPSARPVAGLVGRILEALRENVETTNGTRANVTPLAKLESGATDAEVITKVNEIIDRLQT